MISIRPATAADAPAVTAIAHAAFEHYIPRIGRPPIPMTIDYAAAIAAGKVWVCGAADDSIDGFVLLENQPDALLLDVIAVSPTAQGQGTGTALLTFADTEARARGYTRIILCTNEAMTENLSYYPHHGYTLTYREDFHGLHRVHFSKDLLPE